MQLVMRSLEAEKSLPPMGLAGQHHFGFTPHRHPPRHSLYALYAPCYLMQLENPKHCSPVEPATMAFNFLLCL